MLARYGGQLVENEASMDSPDKAVILVKSDSGSDLEIKAAGYWATPLQLPRTIFDDFVNASLIRQDAAASKPGRRVFRLTEEGLKRGLAAAPFGKR